MVHLKIAVETHVAVVPVVEPEMAVVGELLEKLVNSALALPYDLYLKMMLLQLLLVD